MNYPKMYRIRQIFEVPKVDNIAETLRHELESIQIHSRIKAGARIAITAGSRGITNIDRILKHLVEILKENSGKPKNQHITEIDSPLNLYIQYFPPKNAHSKVNKGSGCDIGK